MATSMGRAGAGVSHDVTEAGPQQHPPTHQPRWGSRSPFFTQSKRLWLQGPLPGLTAGFQGRGRVLEVQGGPGNHPLLPSAGPQRKQEALDQTGLPAAATAQGHPWGREELTPKALTLQGPGVDQGAWCLPPGLSPEARSQQGGERGRMSNVLPISEEKVSWCQGPRCPRDNRAGCRAPLGDPVREGRRRAGETEAGGRGARSPPWCRRAGSET